MKALTVGQPYAELIRLGLKPIENRSQRFGYRGDVVIHAGKSRAWMDDGDDEQYPNMPFGAFVAVANLYDCVELAKLPPELADNEHANGPWCLLLKDIRPLRTPVPCTGALGLWNVPAACEPAIVEQLREAHEATA